jgi:hypothetical protein
MADAAGRADARDDGQDHVLGAHAGAQRAIDVHPHRSRLALPQALRGHDVRDLRGADAEGEGAERAVGGRVGIAADQRDARLCDALFRSHHVRDALAFIAQVEQRDPACLGVLLDLFDQAAMLRVGNVGGGFSGGRVVVVRGGEGEVGAANRLPALAQPGEARRRSVVHQVPVDIQQVVTIAAIDHHVPLPDLVEQGACITHGSILRVPLLGRHRRCDRVGQRIAERGTSRVPVGRAKASEGLGRRRVTLGRRVLAQSDTSSSSWSHTEMMPPSSKPGRMAIW